MTSNRSYKVSDLLKKEISLIIANEIKDPRLQNINITAVKVSEDIGIATVFYTLIGQSINKSESSIDKDILNKLSGMIRSTLAKNIKIRRIPKIKMLPYSRPWGIGERERENYSYSHIAIYI